MRFVIALALIVGGTLIGPTRAGTPATSPASAPSAVVRVAAVGGINDLDFWKQAAERFENQTGIHIETVVTGNKDNVASIFKKGDIDLITMPNADAVLNLVAGGYALDPQPWVMTDLAIVGPDQDPAGIKGMTAAGEAIRKIVQSKSPLVVHANAGADTIVRSILQADKSDPNEAAVAVLLDDHQRRVLQSAADRKAYTLISRVPFVSGKLDHAGLSLMVAGDPILRRPVVVAVANPAKLPGVHAFEARKLAAFLRSKETQRWIEAFATGKIQGGAFFAITPPHAADVDALLTITGEIAKPLAIEKAALEKLPRQEVRTKDHDGKEAVFAGVLLREVLQSAGVPLGDQQIRGPNLSLYVTAIAADGYSAVFALPELAHDFAERSILLADQRDGKPLAGREGPLRIICPQEARQARWVRGLCSIRIDRANP